MSGSDSSDSGDQQGDRHMFDPGYVHSAGSLSPEGQFVAKH